MEEVSEPYFIEMISAGRIVASVVNGRVKYHSPEESTVQMQLGDAPNLFS